VSLVLALAVLLGGAGIDHVPAVPASPGPAATPGSRPASAASAPGRYRLWARGTASWGRGWAGVVTRLPRGTRIRVCGRLGCWSGRSVGYGPARRTHRVADLSRPVFARICGSPSMGLCRVTVWRA